MPSSIYLSKAVKRIDTKRLFFILFGIFMFVLVTYSPPWGDAVDPSGKHFELSPQGKAAIGLFLLAAIWWVFEVVPIGVTSITIAVMQALFFIRKPEIAFADFMNPSVWFIIGSIVIGMVFTKKDHITF